jgi:hypothetical protein
LGRALPPREWGRTGDARRARSLSSARCCLPPSLPLYTVPPLLVMILPLCVQWVDAGHLCATEQNPTPEGTSMYRRHMSKGMFVTHWPYGTTTEVRAAVVVSVVAVVVAAEQKRLALLTWWSRGGRTRQPRSP